MIFRTTAKGFNFARVEFVPAVGKGIIAKLAGWTSVAVKGPGVDEPAAVQLAAHFAELRNGVTAGFPMQAARYDRKTSRFLGVQTIGSLDQAITLNHSNAKPGSEFFFMMIGAEPLVSNPTPGPLPRWGAKLALSIDALLRRIRKAELGSRQLDYELPSITDAPLSRNPIILMGAAASLAKLEAPWRFLDRVLISQIVVLDNAASAYATRLYATGKLGQSLPVTPPETSAVAVVEELSKADLPANWGIAAGASVGIPIAAMLTGAATS